MAALDLLLLAGGHAVVAQVVEAELGVGAVGDVAVVLLAPHAGRLVVQDAADRQAEELIDRAHPLAVARRQVIVHRDDVDAAPAQGVEIDRERGDERLAFAGGHFGDSACVQGIAADELHVERDHLPRQRVFADDNLRAAEPPAGVLDHREGLGQDFSQPAGQLLVVLNLGKLLLPGGGLLAQSVVGDLLQLGLEGVDPRDQRTEALDLAVVLGADELLYDVPNHDCFNYSQTLREPRRGVKDRPEAWQALFPSNGLLAQCIVGQLLQIGFEGVDASDQGTEPPDLTVVLGANKLLYDVPNHD